MKRRVNVALVVGCLEAESVEDEENVQRKVACDRLPPLAISGVTCSATRERWSLCPKASFSPSNSYFYVLLNTPSSFLFN